MHRTRRVLMTADTVGGVWTYALELARALQPHGIEIELATMGAPLSADQRAEAAKLLHVTLHESEYRLEWMDDPWRDVDAAGEWLLALAARTEPNVIHLNGYAHAALPWQVPVLVAAHSCVLSWWKAVKGGAPSKRLAEYQRRVEAGLRNADLIVAPTGSMLDSLDAHYQSFTAGRVIPNGRDQRMFHFRKKEPFIFSAGRAWDEAKNLALLERIAPDLQWPIVLAGDEAEPGKPGWTQRSARHVGKLAPQEMANRLAAASIFASPARYEPFGLAILEAALSGCALVLSDIPSLRENWDGAAVFLRPDHPELWAETLNRLAADPVALEELGISAHERAQQFSTDAFALGYLDAYRELTGAASIGFATA